MSEDDAQNLPKPIDPSTEGGSPLSPSPVASNASPNALPPEVIAKLLKQFDEIAKEVKEASKSDEGWSLLRDGSAKYQGIRLATKAKDDCPIKSGKASGLTKGLPKDILALLSGVEYYSQVDPLFVSGKTLQDVDHDHEILYAHYRTGVPLVSDRDFVYMEGRIHESDGGKVVAGLSVEHPAGGLVSGRVRAHVYHTGWNIVPVETPTKEEKLAAGYFEGDEGPWCYITFIACVDLKGWIPAWVINQMSGEISKSILSVRKFMLKVSKGEIKLS